MTKYIECWGADKPFANITENTLAKNIGLTSIAMIESNLIPNKSNCFDFSKWCKKDEMNPVTLWFGDAVQEREYRNQPDIQFKYYVASSMVIFVCMGIVQALTVPSSVLSLSIISVFLRVGFILKLCLMAFSAIMHVSLFITLPVFRSYFDSHPDSLPDISWQSKLCMCFVVIVTILHVLDRQIEYTSRTDFQWRSKLKIEQDDVETMRGINKILLENILPAHVAEHFLAPRTTQDLYHERYTSIAVMFASIPNYKEFYDENDVNKQGLECLRLLNEIICDFDKLLSKPKFSCIEKIKTIGSTYMLAAGLRPGEEETRGETKEQQHNVIVLVEFAIALMALLDQINKESFQRFKLRMGVYLI
ncbi:hypothetical protein AAG570_013661 [Ranatra chinensis]|uniref:adenylate cyclase n=1 Tax=Ranatra chinensis TaxID=642074 RepID=A0ABD0YCV4_9HEMI